MYNLYSEGNLEFSGLSRNFLFRRLEPWTVYSLTLEACTSAGCTRTPPQHVTTAAAPPASQPPPRPLFVGPDSVSLTWGPPSQPNGPIGEYLLLGRSVEEVGRGRSNDEAVERGKVGETKDTSSGQSDLLSVIKKSLHKITANITGIIFNLYSYITAHQPYSSTCISYRCCSENHPHNMGTPSHIQ